MDNLLNTCIDIVHNFNSISSAVNGADAEIIIQFENVSDSLYDIYNYIEYVKTSIFSSKGSDYKSRVSESMKNKFNEFVEESKEKINKCLVDSEQFLYDYEKKLAFEFAEDFKSKNINDKIISFNELLKKEHKQSFVSSYIANNIYNSNISANTDNKDLIFIMQSNIKLQKMNNKLLFDFRPDSISKNEFIKKIEYPLFINFNILENDKIISKLSELVEMLNIGKVEQNITTESSETHKLFSSLCKSWRMNYSNDLHIFYGEYETEGICDKNEFIYNIENLSSGVVVDSLSGINKQYIEKTKTISRFSNEELRENYISVLSLNKNSFTCYNYIDTFENSAEKASGDVLVVVKKLYGYQVFKMFKVYNNIQLFNPDIISIDNNYTVNKNINYVNNLSKMTPSLYSEKKSNDLSIFVPVKIGNIRHRMLESLKKYVRIQDKIENTNILINIIFSSIYDEILNKMSKDKKLGDEFYMTFYTSISRMVFKLRKDIMDRYNIMKDYDSAKSEMIAILEKSEKNIVKIDNNLHTINNIT